MASHCTSNFSHVSRFIDPTSPRCDILRGRVCHDWEGTSKTIVLLGILAMLTSSSPTFHVILMQYLSSVRLPVSSQIQNHMRTLDTEEKGVRDGPTRSESSTDAATAT